MIIYGVHPVLEALQWRHSSLERIWIVRGRSNPRLRRIIRLAGANGVPLRYEKAEVIRRKAGSEHHQQVVAEVSAIGFTDLDDLLASRPGLVVVLDGVKDPRNLGAVLRTAEAAGAGGVLVPERRTSAVTPAVVKASAGGALHLKIARIKNVARTLDRLKEEGYWIVGLHRGGRDRAADIDSDLELAVVVGGEQRGVRRLVRERCDFLVSLPMRGKVESLNLSVAAGVLLYQLIDR